MSLIGLRRWTRLWGSAASRQRARDDSILVKEAVAEPRVGRLLVGGGSCHSALLGDNVAAIAAANGWEGILIHGAVRHVDAL
ncbi:hypothetical protein ACFXGR_31085 [Streptomyces mirabilis]|uniref:RraA family protein n=1 Tax=Streptomyces mirabilis TaxID=68239 RepID=UPI0036CBC32B